MSLLELSLLLLVYFFSIPLRHINIKSQKNMKKLILIMMLVFGCVIGTYAQKTVFKFRDAQARAGDAVTEVCVKPTVVEVKILEEKGRIKDV